MVISPEELRKTVLLIRGIFYEVGKIRNQHQLEVEGSLSKYTNSWSGLSDEFMDEIDKMIPIFEAHDWDLNTYFERAANLNIGLYDEVVRLEEGYDSRYTEEKVEKHKNDGLKRFQKFKEELGIEISVK